MQPPARYDILLESLDHWFARGAAAAGPGVVPCRSGCSACCHGPFDISPADAALVAQAMALLPEPIRHEVTDRAAHQLDCYRELIEGWGAPWDVDGLDARAFDALTEVLQELPCPALGAEGECLIYTLRPATCRMIGLPMENREGDQLENACPIKGDFPDYSALPPTPFDLHRFESLAEEFDIVASEAGWVATTVAGVAERMQE